ncbi:sterile alpha motif domain-containing protein 3 [Phasianus colchicus]|uniref:Sterile alpha motif domain containing 3 n=1 Tax=Phasianus colchicus TaxID=9054 RepID=A0A669P136_PHACC|nr:sterile alpha motif domain-containing protein 3 [Phasianus colchicus]
MESWSVDQVCNWLRQSNLGELVPKFREEEVSGAALLALNDRMVQQLVKKIGHQAVLMDLINKYKQQKHGLQSFAYVCEAGLPTLPEISGGNLKLCSARCRTCSYTLPNFPYDVKMVLGEKKYPDHSMRIRMVDCLQADMTKYLAGSLYPNSQQYNIVVGALMQAYPFLNEDGNGFLVWKQALKDRFKYVRRAIEDDEQVLKNKCKFGHRKGQSTKSSSVENKPNDVKAQKVEEPAYLEGDAMYVHINWLKQEYMKTLRNWKEVNNKMNATIQIRRKMICDKTPLKDILRLFPFLRCPYQLFREFQLLTHTDVYQKTVKILEIYSESILSLCLVKNNPINVMLQEHLKQNTEENVLKYMKMTAACLLLPDVFGDDSSLFAAVNEEVKVLTPVLEVKNPFNVNSCGFALYIEKQEVARLSDCTTALAALVAAFHVFNIQCPGRIQRTLKFLVSLIFEMNIPQAFLPGQVKRGLEMPKHPSVC